MRLTITCEDCGYKNLLRRSIYDPETVYCICHDCELPLEVEVTAETFAELDKRLARTGAGASSCVPPAWWGWR